MNYKVLVVDDSKLARMVMASAFRRIRPDWSLVETSNADEALATVSKGAVDIALIDFNMPGTDGLELAASIRKTHPGMPVAVVSANVQDEIIGASPRTKRRGSHFNRGALGRGARVVSHGCGGDAQALRVFAFHRGARKRLGRCATHHAFCR